MSNNIIIGINGKKQSGKTTIANILKDLFPERVIILNFGDAVKESLKPIFSFSDDELYGDSKEVINDFWGITPREMMQYFATELMRNGLSKRFDNIGSNVWVLSLERKIKEILKTERNKIIIIADLRFKNEYALIKKYNGLTIKVYNENVENNEYSSHVSENDLDDLTFDYNIHNNGTIESLKENIIKTLKFL